MQVAYIQRWPGLTTSLQGEREGEGERGRGGEGERERGREREGEGVRGGKEEGLLIIVKTCDPYNNKRLEKQYNTQADSSSIYVGATLH